MLKVTIFNKNKKGYDVSIQNRSRKNRYVKWYHVSEKSIITCRGSSIAKRENPEEISWEDLELKVREFHFKQVFPKGTSHKEYITYIYGKDSDKILDFEDWLNSQRYLPKNVAWQIYEQIGIYKRPVLIQSSKYFNVYIVNNQYYVTVLKHTQQIVIETKSEFQKGSKRILDIVRRTGLPNDVVAIIKMIKDDDVAVNILNRLQSLKYDENIMGRLKKYVHYIEHGSKKAANLEKKEIFKRLEKIFGQKTFSKMDLSNSKFTKLADYLLKSS